VGGYVKQVYFHGLFMSNKGVGFSVQEFMINPGRKWGGYVKQVYFHGLFMSNKGVGFSVRELMIGPGRKWGICKTGLLSWSI